MSLSSFRNSVLLLALCLSACGESAESAPASVSLTDGAGLVADDDIDGLDVAIESDGAVDVVWLERVNPRAGSSREWMVHRRGSGNPLRWGPRSVIAEGGGLGNPQVVAAADGVHVYAGARLHHWWRAQATGAFKDMGDLLGQEDPSADAFDAIATGNTVTLAFARPYASGDATIYGVRWADGNARGPFAIATFAPGRAAASAGPLLQGYGQRLVLLWTNTGFFDVFSAKPGQIPDVNDDIDVHASWSDDGGVTWTARSRVATFRTSAVRALASAGTPGAPTVFFASDGLFDSRLTAGSWASPEPIAAYEPGFFAGGRETSVVAATQCNGHTVLAWVDARYRRSDRRPWNPLGGFPWGDDPDWDNNDLFVATDLPQSASAAAALVPLRLTADLSMTRDIAIVERDGQLLVFRSGRARVRKAPNDAGAPPEVTQVSLPCG